MRGLACLLLALIGCGDNTDGYDCDDMRYDNGSCEIGVNCTAPDVDCFVRFDSPEKARAWYDADEEVVALAGTSLPSTDPRYAAAQAQLERGWQAYIGVYEVGDLQHARPYVVLIDDDSVNAFVKADLDKTRAGFAVMINAGLIDLNAPEEQVLGVIMHELEHIIGLHVNFQISSNFRAYYKAPGTSEPLGFEQTDDEGVRGRHENWIKYQQFAGFLSDVELAGFPFTTTRPSVGGAIFVRGLFGEYFGKLVTERRDMLNTTPCTDAVAALSTLHDETRRMRDPVDNGITIPASMTTAFTAALDAVRIQCFAGTSGDAITHLARLSGISDAALRFNAPFEVKFAAESKPLFEGWISAISEGRRIMRDLENGAMLQFGVPWERLRYYSTEEAADDASTRTMIALGLAGDAAAKLLVDATPNLEPACSPLVESKTAPYGENLADDHHGTCWRQMHQRMIGETIPAAKIPWRPPGTTKHSSFVWDEVDAPRTSH